MKITALMTSRRGRLVAALLWVAFILPGPIARTRARVMAYLDAPKWAPAAPLAPAEPASTDREQR